jgi:hypothetical protein
LSRSPVSEISSIVFLIYQYLFIVRPTCYKIA